MTVREKWRELVPHRWEEAFGAERLDLTTAENWEFLGTRVAKRSAVPESL
ncbi:hypothetical protein [Arthrobacter bambusae]|nr:hypothetical protein [Arthrobacter bambusae]MDQ0212461.1 hypothetical protein [Arthrobacter bambusae]MDQ0236909.1 hypothetical protein [Arthrobacter bambusae]